MALCLPSWFLIQSVEDGCLCIIYRGPPHSSAPARHPHMWKRVSEIWFGCMAGHQGWCMFWLYVMDHFGCLSHIQKRFQGKEMVFGSYRSQFLIQLDSWALPGSDPRHNVHSLILGLGSHRRPWTREKGGSGSPCMHKLYLWQQKQVCKTIPLELVYNVSITEPFCFLFSESGFPYVVRLAAN